MVNTIESKSRKAEKEKPTKICPKCGQVRDLNKDFYSNKDWKQQLGKDKWCKQCVGKLQTKDELREYFWENNREWNENLWDKAVKKAEELCSVKPAFQKMPEDRRKVFINSIACQQVPSLMSLFYKFIDNAAGGSNSYQQAKENGEIVEEDLDDNIKVYSQEFNGKFTRKELDYLHNFYKGLEEDFDLSDTGAIDNARKFAKAALQADRAQDRYMSGQCDMTEVKDAIALYDLLSKSGNFAPSKRKPGDNSGLSSWSEITARLESTGHPCTRQIEWPKDDVDRTAAELRYIVESLNLEAM